MITKLYYIIVFKQMRCLFISKKVKNNNGIFPVVINFKIYLLFNRAWTREFSVFKKLLTCQ